MLYTEVLPEIRKLSKSEKIRLIQLLAKDLESDDLGVVPGQFYAVASPDTAFAAAASLLQALEDEKGRP